MLPYCHRRQMQARRERLGVERSLLLEEVHNGPSRPDSDRFF